MKFPDSDKLYVPELNVSSLETDGPLPEIVVGPDAVRVKCNSFAFPP